MKAYLLRIYDKDREEYVFNLESDWIPAIRTTLERKGTVYIIDNIQIQESKGCIHSFITLVASKLETSS